MKLELKTEIISVEKRKGHCRPPTSILLTVIHGAGQLLGAGMAAGDQRGGCSPRGICVTWEQRERSRLSAPLPGASTQFLGRWSWYIISGRLGLGGGIELSLPGLLSEFWTR